MVATERERRIARRFVDIWNQHETPQYTLCDGPNPPDFFLDAANEKSWLEVTDIWMNEAQAKDENCPTEIWHGFVGDASDTAVRLICQLDRKLANPNYGRVVAERGKGMLLLTCQDWAFDTINLDRVDKLLSTFTPSRDQHFFNIAYFEYRLADGRRVWGEVYTGKDLYV